MSFSSSVNLQLVVKIIYLLTFFTCLSTFYYKEFPYLFIQCFSIAWYVSIKIYIIMHYSFSNLPFDANCPPFLSMSRFSRLYRTGSWLLSLLLGSKFPSFLVTFVVCTRLLDSMSRSCCLLLDRRPRIRGASVSLGNEIVCIMIIFANYF